MLRAEQGLLAQNTNQQLLKIRQSELDYFSSVFNGYAFQAALVAGSITNGFEQVLTQPADIPRWLKSGYWITSAIAMAFSIHCLACTSFIMIYAPGLALRGPLGSMTRAVKGMILEHEQIFVSYVGTVVFFGFNMLFCVWSIMYQREAYICSALIVVAMYIWYEYCLRAYNRYGGWDTAIAAEQWEAENKKEADVDEDQDPTHSVPIRLRSDSTSKHEIPSNLLKVQNQAQSGLFGGLFSMNSPATAAAKASTLDSGVGGNAPLKNHVEGYLNLLNTSGLKDTYDRYYFVMEYHNLWYFEEEESYVLYKSKSNKNDSNDPSNSPIISRPIDLSKYKAVQKDKYKKPNIITIEMKDNVSSIQLKTWIVQTDTDEETEMWMKGFQIACHSNF